MAPASSKNAFSSWHMLACILAVIANVGVGSSMLAQDATQSTRLDIGTGVISGVGGGPRNMRWGPSIALQITEKVMTRGQQSLLIAFNAALHISESLGDDCIIRAGSEYDPDARCLEDFPSARTFSLLAGVERRLENRTSLRFLLGPALYRPFKDLHASWGLQSRVDFTVPVQSHVAFVVWGQAGVMPLNNKPAGVPLLYGIGMRVQ